MPDSDGKLTDSEWRHVLNWIAAHDSGEHFCSLCHTGDWSVAPHLVDLRIFIPNITIMGGPSYPQVQMICKNCGHTELINAAFIGLLPNQASKLIDPSCMATIRFPANDN